MCSVSDDRSIRLWRWQYTADMKRAWSNANFSLLNVFNGHTSRVWSGILLNSTYMISIGEVSTEIISSCLSASLVSVFAHLYDPVTFSLRFVTQS